LNDPIKPALACVLATCASEPPLPTARGAFRFQHGSAEQPSTQGMELKATIDGGRIEQVNDGAAGLLPQGVVEQGLLLWHARSRRWIVGSSRSDADADEVGGCSGVPAVVDLVASAYWTC
jgi:hypothetical protein